MKTSRLGLTAILMALAIAPTVGSARADEPVTLEYWVFSDYAQGDALKLQQTFIDEFKKTHANVTINISGKGDDDLTTGEVTGAASGTLPDIFMNGVDVGASLAQAGALKNIYADWMATPKEYRDQFSPDTIATCTPKPETMYCIPYTGFGTFMYRNLTVLKAARHRSRRPDQGLGGLAVADAEDQARRQIRDSGRDTDLAVRRRDLFGHRRSK